MYCCFAYRIKPKSSLDYCQDCIPVFTNLLTFSIICKSGRTKTENMFNYLCQRCQRRYYMAYNLQAMFLVHKAITKTTVNQKL